MDRVAKLKGSKDSDAALSTACAIMLGGERSPVNRRARHAIQTSHSLTQMTLFAQSLAHKKWANLS
jgi:hypothetical protein